jgi:hypothetical protein
MGWTVRGSNPGEGVIFLTRPDRPWGPPSFLYNRYWIFPRGKVAGDVVFDHTHPPNAEVKDRVELYFYSFSGVSWPVLG